MKKVFGCTLIVATISLHGSSEQEKLVDKCSNCRPGQEQRPSANESSKVVIANFLNMFAQFLQMATNPHDKDVLVAGGMGIAQSLANIATQACKCVELHQISAEELLTYITIECEKADVNQALTKQLTYHIKAQYHKSALLPQEIRVRYAEYAEHFDTLAD